MIKFVLGILLIILVASLMNIDCLTCGQGEKVRRSIKTFTNTMKEKK